MPKGLDVKISKIRFETLIKTFIVVGGIFAVGLWGYIITYTSDSRDEGTLRNRYNEVLVLQEKKEVVKKSFAINNIKIRDNFGFIDRTATFCHDEKCTNPEVLRGYRKWIY